MFLLGNRISHLFGGGVGVPWKVTDLLKFCLDLRQGTKQMLSPGFVVYKVETLIAPTLDGCNKN